MKQNAVLDPIHTEQKRSRMRNYVCYCHAMKNNMESNVIGNARVYPKDSTSDGKQASGLLLRRNVTEVVSLRPGIIYKRLMHINEMVM